MAREALAPGVVSGNRIRRGQTTNSSLASEPVQGNVDCLTAADIQEVSRNKDGTTPATMNGCKYPGINGL